MFAVVSMALVTFSSCGKYEEGPGISLRSKKARVVNTWVIEKYLENGVDLTSDILPFLGSYTIEYKKDETFEILNDGDREIGKWSLDSKKENLEMMYDGSTSKDLAKILRLTNDELWLVEDDGTDKYEIHYKAK
ncbi:MAG: hypothetical protein RIT07_260 [Bacteroidota bacterium]|jgi:hypothetical protein